MADSGTIRTHTITCPDRTTTCTRPAIQEALPTFNHPMDNRRLAPNLARTAEIKMQAPFRFTTRDFRHPTVPKITALGVQLPVLPRLRRQIWDSPRWLPVVGMAVVVAAVRPPTQ